MNFTFQSRHRNADMGTLAKFRNYVFSTSNEEKAAKIRESCLRNPHDYWEITQEMVAPKTEAPPQEVKKKMGRPPIPKIVSINRGMKTVPSEGE